MWKVYMLLGIGKKPLLIADVSAKESIRKMCPEYTKKNRTQIVFMRA